MHGTYLSTTMHMLVMNLFSVAVLWAICNFIGVSLHNEQTQHPLMQLITAPIASKSLALHKQSNFVLPATYSEK